MRKYRNQAYIYLIITAAIWGIAGPVIKYTLNEIDPVPFLAYRFIICSSASILYFLIARPKFPKQKYNLALTFTYGLIAVPLSLGMLFFGLQKAGVLDLTLIGAITPLLVSFGAYIFFKEHITKHEKVGVFIVLTGVFINSIYPLVKSSGIALTGNVFLLLFLFSDAFSVLVSKKLSRNRVDSSVISNIALLLGALVFVPLAIFEYGVEGFLSLISNLSPAAHMGVWYMALISGTLAYFMYIRAQRSIEVSEAILFNYLQPVITIPLAIFWLHEKITFSFLLGAVLIVIGVFMAEYKKRRLQAKA